MSVGKTSHGVLYLYFDEGGNFDFSPSGTAVFTMTCVAMRRPFAGHTALLDLKYDCLEGGLPLECFHATEDRQAVRDQVFAVIAADIAKYTAFCVIIRKNMANPVLRSPQALYPRVFEWLIKYVLPRALASGDSMVVAVTDAIPVNQQKRAVEKAVKTAFKAHLPTGVRYQLLHHQSKSDLNLQIADYFNWAAYRKWEGGDERSYRLIQDAVQPEGDLFAGGDTVYY